MRRSVLSRWACLAESWSKGSPARPRGLHEPGLPWQRASRLVTFVSAAGEYGEGAGRALSSLLRDEMKRFRQFVEKDTGIQTLSDVFYNEMLQKEPGEEDEVPIRAGDFLYTLVMSEAGFPSIYRASAISESMEPELVIRTEELAEDIEGDALHIEALRISRCGGHVLLLVSGADDDSRRVYIRDITRKKTIHQPHMAGALNAEYDVHGAVYLTFADTRGIPSRVCMAEPVMSSVGGKTDVVCVYEDMDPQNFVGIQRTKDWEFMCINSNSKTSSEVHIVYDDGALLRVKKRSKGTEYFVEHFRGYLVISSNHLHGIEQEIFVSKLGRDGKGSLCSGEWMLAYSPNEEASISDMMVNQNAITVLERVFPGIPRVQVLPIQMDGDAMMVKEAYKVPLPDWAIDIRFGSNENYATDKIQLELQSPILPPIEVEWDVVAKQLYCSSSHEHALQESQLILDTYCVTRVALDTADKSVSIPLTLAYRRDARNPSKCLFISYAAYGDNVDMSYQSYLFPLMNRGWKIIFIHARGGGELGYSWHHAGRVPNKINSEKDIMSAITTMVHKGTRVSTNAAFDYLLYDIYGAGIAQPGHVAAMTHSAGAIPVCSGLNKNPSLVNAVVMDSPFVSVLRAMSNRDHALTEHEYEEFGNPNTHNVRDICPASGIQQGQEYPHMLIATGVQDHHVPIEGTLSYAQTIREINDKNKIILWPHAFHGHMPSHHEQLRVRAVQCAFLETLFS